jgi:outer membrane protein OmpA-like peptidoglycan-associated protein
MKKIYFILLFINLCFGQSKKDTLTIYFDSNEYKINSESEVILQTFFLKKTIEITNVAVEGFCDDVGKTNANASLADNRAKIIADYLKNNYSIIATSVIGKGELQTLNSSNPELLRKGNRKAVIVIEYSIKKVKADQDKSVSQYKN